MRITFVVASANLSGGVRVIAEHATILSRRGHEVVVVTLPAPTPSLRRRLHRLLRPHALKPKRRSHLDHGPFEVRVIDERRPVTAADVPDADVIIATWWETAEWVSAMPPSKGRQINFLQGLEVKVGAPEDRVDAVWRSPMHKIVVSDWLASIARDRYGDTDVSLVPNGVDLELFTPGERRRSGRGIVGGLATGTRMKRFDLACDAIRLLEERGVACDFIGFGANPASFQMLPPGARFEASPPQDRIAEIYRQCDCWLFTSEYEGYGLPILEALASGTPVVATPSGAAPELLASGGGTLVEDATPESLADAVAAIIDADDDAWTAMSRAARAEAERHSWEAAATSMEAALERAARRDTPSAAARQ